MQCRDISVYIIRTSHQGLKLFPCNDTIAMLKYYQHENLCDCEN